MKSPPGLEIYLGMQKQKGKEQDPGGMGADLCRQGKGPLCFSGPLDFFLKHCPKVH